jgi:prolyl-tRNA editing enzyme YbaK/EbsC (Cys-tRNA(Pro) deacylase)
VKSLVFTADGRPLLVAPPAPTGWTRRLASGGRPDPARRSETVRQATGYAIGGVPPIGLASPLAVYVDRDLLGYELVTQRRAAGMRVPDRAGELVRATGGRVVDIKEARAIRKERAMRLKTRLALITGAGSGSGGDGGPLRA